jgi:hypothetical protein
MGRMGDRVMKTNISILVNVEGMIIEDGAQAGTARWLANVIRIGIGVEHAEHGIPTSPVECDETNGVITINEGRQP